jgi:hypothetical protein
MTEDAADQVVRWTARAALLLYATALAFGFPRRGAGSRLRTVDVCYLAGLAVYLVHVACAFGLLHGWSHAAAYEHTARRTAETIGWSWGGGLWFNYLLTAAWLVDGLWLAVRPASYRSRDIRIDAAVQTFILFMAVNATVAFGPPLTRWIALGILAAVWCFRCRMRAAI